MPDAGGDIIDHHTITNANELRAVCLFAADTQYSCLSRDYVVLIVCCQMGVVMLTALHGDNEHSDDL